ncbi:PLP-dependent cysteine synthase family protein [Roseateles sp. DXS20W]|uniref:PLP-dependent cysteine synthase family protein n=1 Tax=Pelomonas lactea TaxID=3299030 RepID=A0ABW7GQD0_9BURK
MSPAAAFNSATDQDVLDRYPPLRERLANVVNTPLVALPGGPGEATIWAKCEFMNRAGGTVKDRTAFAMLHQLLKERVSSSRALHVLEYTGGGLGVSLARLCAALDIRLTLVLSASSPETLLHELRELGTEVVVSPSEQGFWGVMEAARRLAAANPECSFLNQHHNQANLRMHRITTGVEIAAQLPSGASDGPCAWIASIGTGGTLMGVQAALRAHLPHLQVFATSPRELPYASALAPNGNPKFLGSGGLGCGRKQPFVEADEHRLSGHYQIGYPRALLAMRELHQSTGYRVGSSGAANWLAARELARRLGPTGNVVTILPSAATPNEWSKAESLTRADGAPLTFDPGHCTDLLLSSTP